MSDVTRILGEIEQGDPAAAEQLLPLVYQELRQLAAAKLAHEKPGLTLQTTALVHEAYLRLVHNQQEPAWNSKGHFFAAAAQAMRRILIENARRRKSDRHGGHLVRQTLREDQIAAEVCDDQVLAVDDALESLKTEQPIIGQLVELRYFGGLTIEQAAGVLCISTRSANRYWVYAKAWLTDRIG